MSSLSSELSHGPVESFWAGFARALRKRVEVAHYETWLARLLCRGLKDAEIELVAPNGFTRDWVQRHYLQEIENAARGVDGNVRRVRILQASEVEERELARLGSLAGHAGGIPIVPLMTPSPMLGLTGVTGGEPRGESRGAAVGAGGAGELDAGEPSAGFAGEDACGGAVGPTALGGSSYESEPYDTPGAPARPAEPLHENTRGRRHRSGGDPIHPHSLDYFGSHSEFALNDALTFEQFVTGGCNELAHASARAVAEFPGRSYNPLFIHGASGLGKTHLLQAICHAVMRAPAPRRILYLSCENFVNQFITAVTAGELEAFRYKYRKVDMLLIDDVQFLEGKTRTQEEFFHTFNTLYNSKRQIVLTSDRSPTAIATLQDRLVSRFRWGMVAKVDQPCFETRVAILTRKARVWGVDLPRDVAGCLAEHIDTNIRELEGAVTKVVGYSNLVGKRLDVGVCYEALRDLLPERAQVTVQDVLTVVSKEFGVPAKELQSKRRIKSVVEPRHVGVYLARKHTRMSLEEIGGFFGGRDHSTVLHSIKRVEQMIHEDSAMAERIRRLRSQLGEG